MRRDLELLILSFGPAAVSRREKEAVVVRKAFTLVELLVVIGIIALLAALLMPALHSARESARQTQCASNLRTIAIGINLYAQEHAGWLPGPGGEPQQPWDWIYWYGAPPYDTFAGGPINRYIGSTDPSLFRCPSDPWATHTAMTASSRQPYYYSYQMNCFAPITRYQCCTYGVPCKMPSVRHASDKILLIDANEATAVDGAWVPPPSAGSSLADLSDRHDRHNGSPLQRRGNVAFVDTHVEFVTRSFAHEPRHYLP